MRGILESIRHPGNTLETGRRCDIKGSPITDTGRGAVSGGAHDRASRFLAGRPRRDPAAWRVLPRAFAQVPQDGKAGASAPAVAQPQDIRASGPIIRWEAHRNHGGVGATVEGRSTLAGATSGAGARGRQTTKRLPRPGIGQMMRPRLISKEHVKTTADAGGVAGVSTHCLRERGHGGGACVSCDLDGPPCELRRSTLPLCGRFVRIPRRSSPISKM